MTADAWSATLKRHLHFTGFSGGRCDLTVRRPPPSDFLRPPLSPPVIPLSVETLSVGWQENLEGLSGNSLIGP